jgi:acetyl esterase/lipase
MSIILSIGNCEKNISSQPMALPEQTFLNVSYDTDSAQKMDIYLPAARTKDSTKVIMLIHGGAWNGGDKADFASYITLLKKKLPDYAVVNINYRLATQKTNHFPAQENDVQSAIDFLYKKRGDYQLSDKLVLLGASAGAHLALLHAYKYSDPVKIQSLISFFGPTDLTSMYNSITNSYYQWAMQVLIGGTPVNNIDAFQKSSPLFFVNAKSCPTLLLHGAKDPLVPVSHSKTLHNKLKAAGAETRLVIYPNEGHGWYGATLENSFEKIASFLQDNVE